MIRLRDTIVEDPVALDKWHMIVDHIVEREDDKARIKKLIRKESEYAAAILESLDIWNGYGDERVDLLKVVREHGLNKLSERIQNLGLLNLNARDKFRNNKAKTGVWFDVGEVVYNFTGRETQLVSLQQMLAGSHSTRSVAANIISICGLGGIGKSTLAREYAHRYRNEYDENVIWINAETVESMKTSFVRLAAEIGLGNCEQESNEQIARKAYKFFNDRNSLFIFDNVEEKSHFKKFQPVIENPRNQTPYILVTTRRDDIAPLTGNQLNLDVLELEEAVKLIQKQIPNGRDACAEELAAALQRLPLALQQALAYISDKYFKNDADCISKYLKEFEKSEQALLNDERFKENNDYSRTTFTTWGLTLARIMEMEDGESAIRAIQALAYLNPDLITVQFVESIIQDEADTQLGLKLLERFSMLSVRDRKIRIHRLVQKVIRLNLSSEEEVRTLKPIIEAISAQLDKKMFTDYTRECTSHGLHLFPFQVNRESELMKERSVYLSDLSYFLVQYGNYSDGLSVAERSSSVYEAMPGVHEDTITMKWETAYVHLLLGNYSQAMELLESILPISKCRLGEEHRLTMNIRSSMARTLAEMGDYDEAIKLNDEIIPMQARLNGEHHLKVLEAKQSKANALRMSGNLREALKLSQFVYESRVELNGASDVRTLNVNEDISYVFVLNGDIQKAIEIWKEIYEVRKQVLGESHPTTIRVKLNMEEAKSVLKRGPWFQCDWFGWFS